ncbi:hypothetical protein [Nocardia arthritidis]|uniref:Lipoprotein n=1 Tax=Nocardia arthritidis TaxID=228602 RepID=A0A6G9YLK9_9NOCA|nr:hypothetical protein [Nocardia arthritidis]QIS14159.1 hypothetical protein F5544_31590 [Nocardia arthritidis]
MRRSAAILASAAAVGLLLTGCSGRSADRPAATGYPAATAPTGPGPVDPAHYKNSGGYFFHSGEIFCAILDEAVDQSRHSAGCQGATPAPPEMTACWASDPVAAALAVGESASYLCVNRGLFVGPPAEDGADRGGGPVLPAGSSLSVHGFTCRAEHIGVSCHNDANGRGFDMAPGFNRVY